MKKVWLILANSQQKGQEYITHITKGFQMNRETQYKDLNSVEIFSVKIKQFELIQHIYFIPLSHQEHTIEEFYQMFIKYQINTIEGIIIIGTIHQQNIPTITAIQEMTHYNQFENNNNQYQIIMMQHDLTTQLRTFQAKNRYLYICISKSSSMNYYFLKTLTPLMKPDNYLQNSMARLFYWKCEENNQIKHNYYIDLEVSEKFEQSQFQKYLHQVAKYLQKDSIDGFLFIESLNQPAVTVIETIGQFCNWHYELNNEFYNSSLVIIMNSTLSQEKVVRKQAFLEEYVKKQMPKLKIAQHAIDICTQAIADLEPQKMILFF